MCSLINLLVGIAIIVTLPLQVANLFDVAIRRVRDAWVPEGITYRATKEKIPLGAEPTEVHYTVFDPSENKVQMVIQVQEEFINGRYVLHSFDFEKGRVWMEDKEKGRTLEGDKEVFGARILPKEHIARFEKATGKKVVGLTGAGNIGWNDWFVGYLNGQFIASVEEREKLTQRSYSSLVVFKDGTVKIQKLEYKIEKSKVEVIDKQTGELITDKVSYATFGQRLVETRLPENVTIAVDPAEIYKQFDDIRQVLKLPVLFPLEDFRGGGIYLGFDQLYKNNKRLVGKALGGAVIELNLTVDYTNMQLTDKQVKYLKDYLKKNGYSEVSSPDEVKTEGMFYVTENIIKVKLRPDTLKQALKRTEVIQGKTLEMGYRDVGNPGQVKAKGDYAISGDKLYIKLLDGIYPQHIEAITKSGKVVSIVVTGSSGWTGGTLRGITQWLLNNPEFKADPIVDALLIDNGNDHMLKVGERWVVNPAQGTREGKIQAVILLVSP